jgi:phage terminase large subunit-like protein
VSYFIRANSKWWSQGRTREWWETQDREQKRAFLLKMTDQQVEEFLHDWMVWARDEQMPPDWDWDTWLLLAGRGFGKTRTAVETIIGWVQEGWCKRIAIVGQGEDDVRTVMVNGVSGFIECSPSWNKPVFRPSVGGGMVLWPKYGATAFIYSIADTEALRGPAFHAGWCDEPMAAPRVQRERALDNLEFCLREGEHPRLIITTTPKPDPWLRKMEKDAKKPENKIAVTRGSTHANAANLATNFLKKIERNYGGTKKGKQEIEGKILTDEENALWTEEVIDAARLTEARSRALGFGGTLDPHEIAALCDKVLVSVDPNTKGGETAAAKSKKVAHAAGIVVMGKKDRKIIFIADRSIGGGPAKWGRAAVRAAEEFDAGEIHAESNQGGEMVRIVVQQQMEALDFVVPVHLKFGNKSKAGRAEPVAARFASGDVYVLGQFPELEDQMLYIHEGEDPTGEDFDRLDAMVWGATRLGLKKRAFSGTGTSHGGFGTFGGMTDGTSAATRGAGDGFDGVDTEL